VNELEILVIGLRVIAAMAVVAASIIGVIDWRHNE